MSGYIKDTKGTPLPFVNVFFKNTAIGTITNDKGKFSLYSDTTQEELEVSLLGYVNQKLELNDKNENILIVLKEGEQLDEIILVQKPKKRLRKKQNPAYPILKKIWEKKRRNGRNYFSALEYQKFTSFEVGIENLDSTFLKTVLREDYDSLSKIINQKNKGKTYMPLNLKEKVESVFISDSLNLKKTAILGERITGLKTNGFFFDQMQRIFQDIDVYKNRILFADKIFESPLSRNGFLTYDYLLLDSIDVKNEKLFNIYFFPRRSEDLAFTGDFTVSVPSYSITKINLRIDPKINLNLVSGLDLEKTYSIVNDSIYLPKSNHYSTSFSSLKKTEKGKMVTAIKKEYYDHYAINKPFEESFYRDTQKKISQDQFKENSVFWDDIENDLNYSRYTRKILTQVDENNKMNKIVRFTDFITGGYFTIYPGVQFGKWWNSLSNNDVEGNRIRLGFRSFKSIEDRLRSNAYIAYGFKDKSLKYAFEIKHLLNEMPRVTVGAVYSKDFEQLGNRFLSSKNLIDFSSAATNSFFARGLNYYLSNIERFGTNLDFGFTDNFHLGLNFISENISSAAPSFFNISAFLNNKIISNYKNVQLNSYVHYTPRRNVFGYGVEQKLGKNLHAEFLLKYSQGIKGLLGGVLDYRKIQFSYNQTLLLNFLGNIDANLELGKTYGIIPLPLLSAIPSNQGYSMKPKTFALLNYYDLVTDSYIMGHFEHHFNGFITNKTPFIKNLNFRALATFRFAYGSISSQNNEINRSNIQYNSPDGSVYYEYGVGFENIGYGNLRFFRIDLIWRSPLSASFKLNPYSSELPNFGIRIGAKPSL